MKHLLQLFIGSFAVLVFSVGCRNSGNSNSSSASNGATSCSYKKEGTLVICTQYQDLSGSALAAIQSECELRSAEGYSWSVASCPNSTVGTCSLAATAQRPATSTQYYYGTAFSDAGTASGMCNAQGGTFK